MKLLVLGYGNPGRLDDGLGPAFAEAVRALEWPGVAVESNYQLNIEDAELVARFDVVVFADASVNAAEPFAFGPLEPHPPMVGFSSHSITAPSLLGLAAELFGAHPRAYAMAIRGYLFDDFGEGLSPGAADNLAYAIAFFKAWVQAGADQSP